MSSAESKRRTFDFGIRVVRRVQALPKGDAPRELGRLLRSGMSVGANYRAAARARSRADFVSKLGIVEEESDETLYWIEVLIELGLVKAKRVRPLYAEGSEIVAMIVSSLTTARPSRKQLRSKRTAKRKISRPRK